MTYIPKSVPRALGNPGLPIQPLDSLTLINVRDIAFMPSPDSKGVVIADDIVMKPGCYPVTIYMTPGTAALTSAAEGDTDQVGFTPSLSFNHPGNSVEVREFKVNELNSKFIAIMRYCSGRPADLIGTPCNPCKITPSYTGNNEGNTNAFTVAQIYKGNDVFIYTGAIPMEEPVAVLESGAKSVDYVSDGCYQLAGGAASVTSITGGAHGSLVTLLGTSGVAPTLPATEGKIVLRGGRQFTASEGSQITLRAFDAGGDSPIWIEQSRYEAS